MKYFETSLNKRLVHNWGVKCLLGDLGQNYGNTTRKGSTPSLCECKISGWGKHAIKEMIHKPMPPLNSNSYIGRTKTGNVS